MMENNKITVTAKCPRCNKESNMTIDEDTMYALLRTWYNKNDKQTNMA